MHNIGDYIELLPNIQQCLNEEESKFLIIGKKDSSYIIGSSQGWKINQKDLKQFNIDSRYLNQGAWEILCNRIF